MHHDGCNYCGEDFANGDAMHDRCPICTGQIPTTADYAERAGYGSDWTALFCAHEQLVNVRPAGRPSAGWR